MIPFRGDYLLQSNSLSETPLERIDSVDMMRVIEHGEHVHRVIADAETLGVDTPAELERVSKLMMSDSLRKNYQGV